MGKGQDWREIVASSLGWEQAHTNLEHAVEDFPRELRGQRPEGYPHSAWELLEHIRITQRDLLDFCQNPDYKEELAWPQDYWPSSPAPGSAAAWTRSVNACKKDRETLAKFATDSDVDLTSRIPRGTGQTYLRTLLVALDHASYHVGQIVAVRRLLGAWPAK
ncbi:MAG TPA: DinB family protein [Gemmatimonadaceae bacterium]|jgi:uncharacterized damage-inducible protein DinB|nr:DinB family protein [Gemmatimonadaceae bacterium]